MDSTSNNFKIALVQLEAGTVATPFEARDVGTELALCERYLYKVAHDGTSGNVIAVGQCYGTTAAILVVPLPQQMRVSPTGITASNAGHINLSQANTTGVAGTGIAFLAERFKGLSRPGSLTDCGRVFLILGEPDEVREEGRPEGLVRRSPETWTYKDKPSARITFAGG